jgi:hypothetical protein
MPSVAQVGGYEGSKRAIQKYDARRKELPVTRSPRGRPIQQLRADRRHLLYFVGQSALGPEPPPPLAPCGDSLFGVYTTSMPRLLCAHASHGHAQTPPTFTHSHFVGTISTSPLHQILQKHANVGRARPDFLLHL